MIEPWLDTPIAIVTAMAVVTFVPRFLGLSFARRGQDFGPGVRRFLRFVPITVFAASIGPALVVGDGSTPLRLVAAAASTVVLLGTRSLAWGLASGMVAYWGVRALTSGLG